MCMFCAAVPVTAAVGEAVEQQHDAGDQAEMAGDRFDRALAEAQMRRRDQAAVDGLDVGDRGEARDPLEDGGAIERRHGRAGDGVREHADGSPGEDDDDAGVLGHRDGQVVPGRSGGPGAGPARPGTTGLAMIRIGCVASSTSSAM